MSIGLLPWIVVAIVAFVVLRMVVGAIKSSLKMILVLAILLAAGFGWLWWQSNHGNASSSPQLPPAGYSWSNGP